MTSPLMTVTTSWPGPRCATRAMTLGQAGCDRGSRAGHALGVGITTVRGLHLTGAAQVSALPPESAWQALDPA